MTTWAAVRSSTLQDLRSRAILVEFSRWTRVFFCKGGKGEGKGKDKNFSQRMYNGEQKQRFEGTHSLCGKTGHKIDDCGHSKKDVKGKGKDAKDRGKNGKDGKGSGQFQGNISYCGQCGHKKADCRFVGTRGGSSTASILGLSAS